MNFQGFLKIDREAVQCVENSTQIEMLGELLEPRASLNIVAPCNSTEISSARSSNLQHNNHSKQLTSVRNCSTCRLIRWNCNSSRFVRQLDQYGGRRHPSSSIHAANYRVHVIEMLDVQQYYVQTKSKTEEWRKEQWNISAGDVSYVACLYEIFILHDGANCAE